MRALRHKFIQIKFAGIYRILSGVGARQCEHVLYDAREPACLVLKNRDLPGVIGIVGTFLGESQVNIARFVLGRGENGSAIAIVQTDTPVSEPILQKLRKLPNILEARSVSFPSA